MWQVRDKYSITQVAAAAAVCGIAVMTMFRWSRSERLPLDVTSVSKVFKGLDGPDLVFLRIGPLPLHLDEDGWVQMYHPKWVLATRLRVCLNTDTALKSFTFSAESGIIRAQFNKVEDNCVMNMTTLFTPNSKL
jgi:hypothetical protein